MRLPHGFTCASHSQHGRVKLFAEPVCVGSPSAQPTNNTTGKTLQAAERQGGELADARSHLQALEAELEGKAREGAALLADSLALKVTPGWPGGGPRGLVAHASNQA